MHNPTHRAPGADPRWARYLARAGVVIAVLAALIVLALAVFSGKADATGSSGGQPAVEETYSGPDGRYVGQVTPGAPCIGDEGDHGVKDGKPYLCWKKRGQDCARWHRVIVPGEPTGKWSPRPYASPCPNCSPSPAPSSAPPSSRPPVSSSTPSPTSSAPPTGGPQLPLTGAGTAALTGLGVLLLLAGIGMARLSRAGRRQ